MNKILSNEEEQWVLEHINDYEYIDDLIAEIIKRTGKNFTKSNVYRLIKRNNINKSFKMKHQIFYEEHELWIRKNIKGHQYPELYAMFKEVFPEHPATIEQLRKFAKRLKLCTGTQALNGLNSRYKPGEQVRNIGNRFEKGHKPYNTVPIGTINCSKNKDVYKIKVSENKWVNYARYVYEKANGPIPKGYEIIHKDGNKFNYALENLDVLPGSIAKSYQHLDVEKNIENYEMLKTYALMKNTLGKMIKKKRRKK